MDQKHAMLYPELQANANQRALASNAIGLPTDPLAHQQQQQHIEPPPPSYDVAVSVTGGTTSESNVTDDWYQNSGYQPTIPTTNTNAAQNILQNQQFSRNEPNTRSFVEQPSLPAVNVITQQHFPKLGPHPCTVFCPSCGTARMTRMAYTPNTRTHFCALLLCLVGWCCCACFVPYCTNSCRTGNHYCAVCNTFLGSYNAQENI